MASGILRPKNSKINTRQQLKRERATLTANYCAHFRMESIEKHITILHKIKVFRLYIKSEREVEREREGDWAIESYKARMSFWSTVAYCVLFFCLSIVARLFVARRARSNKLLQKQWQQWNNNKERERERDNKTSRTVTQIYATAATTLKNQIV